MGGRREHTRRRLLVNQQCLPCQKPTKALRQMCTLPINPQKLQWVNSSYIPDRKYIFCALDLQKLVNDDEPIGVQEFGWDVGRVRYEPKGGDV